MVINGTIFVRTGVIWFSRSPCTISHTTVQVRTRLPTAFLVDICGGNIKPSNSFACCIRSESSETCNYQKSAIQKLKRLPCIISIKIMSKYWQYRITRRAHGCSFRVVSVTTVYEDCIPTSIGIEFKSQRAGYGCSLGVTFK